MIVYAHRNVWAILAMGIGGVNQMYGLAGS
jgi:hypothetical protein